MKILRVHISNLNSLRGEWTIDFGEPPLSQTGIFAITGPTGAGKTTVLDAITLALYGALARSKEVKEVLSYGTTACQAEVEFQAAGVRYLASWGIYRARGKQDGNLIGPKRTLARWNAEREAFEIVAEKVREMDQAVESITGLDYHRFTRSVLLSQGDFAAFLKADERERSELLERITGTEIYSEISQAAFARAKVEQQKLDRLQEQLRNLGVLAEEPVDEEELAGVRKQTGQAQHTVEQTRQTLQAAERYHEALAQLEQLAETAKVLEKRQGAFATEHKRLLRTQALRPHYADLDDWRRLGKSLDEQRAEVSNLEQQQQLLRTQLAEQTTKRQETARHLQEVRTQVAARREQLQEAALLSQQLAREGRSLAEQQEAIEKARQHCDSWKTALDSTRENLKQQQTLETEIREWLTSHKAAAALEQRLPAIEEQRERLAEIYRERERQLTEQQQLDAEVAELQAKVTALSQQLAQRQQAAARQLESLRSVFPARFDLNREEAVDRLREEIRRLDLRARELLQLRELDQQYQELLQEQEKGQAQLAGLLADQEQLTKAILNKVEEQDAYRPTLAYRQKVYQQQQRIANYTKDRQQLEPGAPCPLCGSTEHPYHEEVEDYTDEALAEYEAAQAHYAQLQREERQLLQRENEIAQEIAMLRGQDLEQVSGRLAQQEARMLTFEARIAGLLQVGEDGAGELRGTLLAERIDKVNKQLSEWQEAETQVTALHKTLQRELQEELELEKALTGAQARLDARAAEAARVREQVKETGQRYAMAISRVDEQLAPLGHHFDLATAKQVFAELRERAREYRDKEAARAEAARQVDLLSNKAEQVAPQLEKLKQELSTQEQQLAQATLEVEKLEQQLSTLLGGQSLEELRTAVEDTLAQAEAQGRAVEEKWHEIKSQVATNEQRYQDRQLSIKRLDTERQALEQRLLPALKSLGYEDPASAQAHRLTPAEEEALEAESQAIRLALAEHDTAKKAARQQRDKWKEAAGSEVEELRAQLREQEANYQQLLRQLGQLEEKQAQAEKRAVQHASLMEAIDKQRQEFNRWAQLNELIGQADGKKFRTFAQGLTLQKLVALANAHLERLNGRYLIHKRPEADLELDIIDTFQADNRRSMYTLSGGESFLVSLALALGLSDLAGKQAQIQSLFIDEGFGTLDEHSLDLALDTLENLQSSGKTIGVISHVKALKERIGVQVQIEKGSNGFSKLQVV